MGGGRVGTEPACVMAVRVAGPMVGQIHSLMGGFQVPLGLLSPLFMFYFTIIFLTVARLGLRRTGMREGFRIPCSVHVSLELRSRGSNGAFKYNVLC